MKDETQEVAVRRRFRIENNDLRWDGTWETLTRHQDRFIYEGMQQTSSGVHEYEFKDIPEGSSGWMYSNFYEPRTKGLRYFVDAEKP